MNDPIDWLAVAMGGEIVIDIGQIPKGQRRALDRAAKRGELVKWRGFWNNPLGTWGLGPMKSCFARRPSCHVQWRGWGGEIEASR